MKTLLLQTFFASAPPPQPLRPRRQRRAFSLVEVTLALGIVTFGLVSVVGVLPTALASGRQSFDQNRAAAIANTLFTSFRSQPFSKVCYVDQQLSENGTTPSGNQAAPTIDFNLPQSAIFYARYLSLATDPSESNDSYGTQRLLFFFPPPNQSADSKLSPTGADYQIALNFNNTATATVPASDQPEGMIASGQACRVEIVINAVSRPGDQYRFVSTVANRSN